MQADYRSGDPYLAFAKRAGALPPDATKETHPGERDLFKVCCGLGAMYGAGARTLAGRLGVSEARARELLDLHHATYPRYWAWADARQDRAMLTNELHAVFGWKVNVGADSNPRSLGNFTMQANGAEMMRIAACLLTERGVEVCGVVHDAFLIEAPSARVDDVVAETKEVMREASELVLPGFPLRTDAVVVRHPGRFSDARGRRMWAAVGKLLGGGGASEGAPAGEGMAVA
jgi:DNA polymerase I-like protein with 3'-5' exonuclease and polymerase domains